MRLGTVQRALRALVDAGMLVKEFRPDLVVLDVMLPDTDGWRLLMHLRQHPLTRSTPVIICSVVQESDLASSLGAALYLSKPVRPRQFIQALILSPTRELA
mgnify:CR=1 FL=1